MKKDMPENKDYAEKTKERKESANMPNSEPDKKEILCYLGYNGQIIDSKVNALIDNCAVRLQNAVKPRYTYKIFKIEEKDNGIQPSETELILTGNDIKNHLKGCGYCAVLAATLGIAADNIIRVAQNISMSEAVVYDACAAESIERVCDKVCAEIENEINSKVNSGTKLKLTSRFSAGYGDLPIELQPEILRLTDAERKIGLTVTESNIMIPRKSVTAIVGIYSGERKPEVLKDCGTCNLKDSCMYRKRGVLCNDKR